MMFSVETLSDVTLLMFTGETIYDIAAYAALYLFLCRKWKKEDRLLPMTLLYVSCVIVLCMTLSPLLMSFLRISSIGDARYNWIPFVDWIYHYGHYQAETLFNILMFIPFGMALPYAKKYSLPKTVLYGLVFSITVEFIQPIISSYRICDITDMITNTFGAFLGAWIFYKLIHKKK